MFAKLPELSASEPVPGSYRWRRYFELRHCLQEPLLECKRKLLSLSSCHPAENMSLKVQGTRQTLIIYEGREGCPKAKGIISKWQH